MKNLRKRFILFNVIVISGIILLAALFIFVGAGGSIPEWHRPFTHYIPSIFAIIGVVFIGSWLLSKAAVKPIQEAWQKQLDFTADASHELRTPIAAIQTNLELVMDSPEETVSSQMKWLRNIEAEHRRMARLVDDLLTLSRADTGQQLTQKETFALDEAVREAAEPLIPIAAAKGIGFIINVDEIDAAKIDANVKNENKSLPFYGDKKRITQLVVILAHNAICYTDCGSVSVALSATEKHFTLTVSDTGRGIAPEHLGKIFDRFYRVTQTRAMHQDGSGLGLSIARWIAREHGGSIRVLSKVGRGTEVVAELAKR